MAINSTAVIRPICVRKSPEKLFASIDVSNKLISCFHQISFVRQLWVHMQKHQVVQTALPHGCSHVAFNPFRCWERSFTDGIGSRYHYQYLSQLHNFRIKLLFCGSEATKQCNDVADVDLFHVIIKTGCNLLEKTQLSFNR